MNSIFMPKAKSCPGFRDSSFFVLSTLGLCAELCLLLAGFIPGYGAALQVNRTMITAYAARIGKSSATHDLILFLVIEWGNGFFVKDQFPVQVNRFLFHLNLCLEFKNLVSSKINRLILAGLSPETGKIC
jgi:hypothetical protein